MLTSPVEKRDEILEWPVPSLFPALGRQDAHIWAAPAQASPTEEAFYLGLLSREEQDRYASLQRELSRQTFATVRGILRCLLGRYLGCSSADIQFAYGTHGKPRLSGACGKALHFNVSHSEEIALIAVSRLPGLGVDVERYRLQFSANQLAQRFFSARENMALHKKTGKERREFFFKYWTCKEAFIKATGAGLATPLDQVCVSFQRRGSPRLLSVPEGAGAERDWQLHTVSPAKDYAAAFVAPKELRRLTTWQWNSRFGQAPCTPAQSQTNSQPAGVCHWSVRNAYE